jgi:hypothetical protein
MLSRFLLASGRVPQFISSSTARIVSGNDLVISRPSGVQENDFLLAVMVNASGESWESTSGWTERIDNGIRIATKTATASEPASYTFVCQDDNENPTRGVILCFRNVVFQSGGALDASSPYQPPGVTMADVGLLIGVGVRAGDSSQSITLPTSMTPLFNSSPSDTTIAIGMEEVPVGATGSRTFTATSSLSVITLLIGLRKA